MGEMKKKIYKYYVMNVMLKKQVKILKIYGGKEMTNKNPDRPLDMNRIMEQCFNPLYKTNLEQYQQKQKEITESIFS